MNQPNEKMIALPIKDFAKKIICDGHLYLKSKEGRRFYLLKPGLLIDQAFVKKFALTQTVFDFQPVTNQVVIDKFSELFKQLKYLHFEKDLREKTQEIVAAFKEIYSKDEHFLSFALACFNEFCVIPKEDLNRLHETDIHLFRKSLYTAAFSVIIGFGNDFYHYAMIKDFYNISMGLDLGLCESSYSYFVAEACNYENQHPGEGKKWIVGQGATPQEQTVFLQHPLKSHEFFKKNSQILSYPELAEIVLYQHELSNGAGFPRGIPKAQVSSWEAVVVLASSMVDIVADYNFEKNVVNFIFDFQNEKMKEIPVQRVYKKVCMVLGDIYKEKRSAS